MSASVVPSASAVRCSAWKVLSASAPGASAMMAVEGRLVPHAGMCSVAKRVGRIAPIASPTRAATW